MERRKTIQVLAGPRQIGKTTTVLQVVDKLKIPVVSVATDGAIDKSKFWIDQQWESARQALKQSKATSCVLVIDEIQKIEGWSEEVKKNWDKDTKDRLQVKVVLLGSSRLLIQKGLTESLMGRFELIAMTHWNYEMMQNAFDLTPEEYAWYGGYPGGAEYIGNEKRWRDYVLHSLIETTISKDILMLTRIDKPALLKRLFELGCLYSGQILSFTKMLGQLQDAGNTVTLANYLDTLDSAGLLCVLQKFSGSIINSRASIPKFQVYNTALSSVYSGHTFKEAKQNHQLWGRVVETAIGAHLANSSKKENFQLFYWREGNDEVDFVLKQKKSVIALEVKSNATTKLPGMAGFMKKYNKAKPLLVGNSGIMWESFLKSSPEDLF
ncbi:MAG: AAA family ATPase [Bacteroidia bacterium]